MFGQGMATSVRDVNDSTKSGSAILPPFYFIIVLWGERYRNYFLEYCLPSLLAPGNIPALDRARGSKFLVCTTPQDWSAIEAAPIVAALKTFIEVVFIEIPPCPPERSGCEHMNTGHKLACDMAFRAQALALILTPDCMISDGSMANVQALAESGARLVLTAALRFGEEPFFADLERQGLLTAQSRRDTGIPLVITGAQMVHAAVSGMHSETLGYEWDAPYLLPVTPAAWWRVPGEDGIVLHSLSWAPLLIDYSVVQNHDTSTLDGWTIDGDYLYRNLGSDKNVHIVEDSDEVFLASWAPMADRAFVARPIRFFELPGMRAVFKRLKGLLFKSGFYGPVFDPIRRKAFSLTVRWHSCPLNAKWQPVEREAVRELSRWIDFAGLAAGKGGEQPASAFAAIAHLPVNVIRWFSIVWLYHQAIGRRLRQALGGDITAIRRILWNARREKALLMHRVLKESAPSPPAEKSL
jgi:hypothetical protein